MLEEYVKAKKGGKELTARSEPLLNGYIEKFWTPHGQFELDDKHNFDDNEINDFIISIIQKADNK